MHKIAMMLRKSTLKYDEARLGFTLNDINILPKAPGLNRPEAESGWSRVPLEVSATLL